MYKVTIIDTWDGEKEYSHDTLPDALQNIQNRLIGGVPKDNVRLYKEIPLEIIITVGLASSVTE